MQMGMGGGVGKFSRKNRYEGVTLGWGTISK